MMPAGLYRFQVLVDLVDLVVLVDLVACCFKLSLDSGQWTPCLWRGNTSSSEAAWKEKTSAKQIRDTPQLKLKHIDALEKK